MSYWGNLGSALLGTGSVYSRNSQFIGGNKKYKANQADLNYPIEEGFATSSDIFAVTKKISTAGSMIEPILELHKGDDVEIITDGELYDLIQKPNETQTREEFVEQGLLNRLVSGNDYLYPINAIGFDTPSETHLLHPQLIQIDTSFVGKFNTVKQYVYRIGGKNYKISPEELFQLKYYNPTMHGINSMYGLSPLVAGYLTLVGLNNNNIASASILENQGASGILTNESEQTLLPKEQQEQQDILDKKIGGASKFGKIMQSLTKSKFIRLGLDPTQLKIIESKLIKTRDLANVYDMPSVMLNDPANRTHNNMLSAERYFYTNPVLNNLRAFYSFYERSIVSKFNKQEFVNSNAKFKISLDTSKIESLQQDKKKEAEKDKIKMEGVNVVLNMPISQNGKKDLLVNEYGYSEILAESITTTNEDQD